MEYLIPEAIKLLLEQPDKSTKKGRRDLTLLSDSGARVQELIDIKVCDVILEPLAVIKLTGKGNKMRKVPIPKNTLALLQNYFIEHELDKPRKNDYPLFTNNQHHKLTRKGIAYIVSKYATLARKASKVVKVHMLRHSKAMHLLQAGVNLVYIRDFLGRRFMEQPASF